MERVLTVGQVVKAVRAGDLAVRALGLGGACMVGVLEGANEGWVYRTAAAAPSLPPDASGAGLGEHQCVIPLRVAESSMGGRRIRAYLVGRSSTNDVAIDLNSVSKIHARILQAEDGTWLLEDADSKNGTFLDGVKVGTTPVKLEDGASVLFGSQPLAFFTTPALLRLVKLRLVDRR